MSPLTARPSLRQRLLRGMRVAFVISVGVIGLVELLGVLTYLAAFSGRSIVLGRAAHADATTVTPR